MGPKQRAAGREDMQVKLRQLVHNRSFDPPTRPVPLTVSVVPEEAGTVSFCCGDVVPATWTILEPGNPCPTPRQFAAYLMFGQLVPTTQE